MEYSSFSSRTVRFGSVISVVSVTSSSKQVGETLCLRNTERKREMKLTCFNCFRLRLMDTRPGCATCCCQRR
jgi:hypothetical protein